jgi:hypothetical protein
MALSTLSSPTTASPADTGQLPKGRRPRWWHGLEARFGRLKRVVKRRRKLAAADVVVVSHAKSGRTWLATMISHVYHRRYGIAESELLQFDSFQKLDDRVPRILFSHDNRKDEEKTPLFKPRDLGRQKVVLLVRNPCDVAVSSYFQSFRDARKGQGPGHAGGPIAGYVLDFKLPLVLAWLCRWHDQLDQIRQLLVVRYEDLRVAPDQELARIFTFIEGQADPDEIAAAVAFASFEQMKQKEAANFFKSDKLRPGDPADPQSFKVRKGKVGGYREHFTSEELVRIDQQLTKAELHRFGYTADPNRSETVP